jgi:hypothetical protein
MVKTPSKFGGVLRALELLLFGFALFIAIPPVPSLEPHVYHFLPGAVIGGSALALSIFLAARRGAENWVAALLKLAFYLLFLWIMTERMNIH